jgi:hypothetical protein
MINKFAKIKDGKVEDIILASSEALHAFNTGDSWVNISKSPFAKIGDNCTYNELTEAYSIYSDQPYNSWILNEDTCLWEAPTGYPTDDSKYTWDEDTVSWIELTTET